MVKFNLNVLFIILVLPALAIAEQTGQSKVPQKYKTAIHELMSAKSIECYFPKGAIANWQGKTMKLEEDKMANAIHYDSIDTSKKKRARMIGNVGATDVLASMSPTGITFVEFTDVGNVMYTTVFPSYLDDKKINSEPDKNKLNFQKAFIAVYSRHIYDPIIGAMPSQFHGYCRILE